jgi:hypothetical protein
MEYHEEHRSDWENFLYCRLVFQSAVSMWRSGGHPENNQTSRWSDRLDRTSFGMEWRIRWFKTAIIQMRP